MKHNKNKNKRHLKCDQSGFENMCSFSIKTIAIIKKNINIKPAFPPVVYKCFNDYIMKVSSCHGSLGTQIPYFVFIEDFLNSCRVSYSNASILAS